MKLPFNKPFIVGAELENIATAVSEGHLAGDGRFTQQCHQWLEQNLGVRRALLTHSCTAALEIVIDGVDEQAVGAAMAAAMRAAAGDGVLVIGAGNYGGKLGKYHFRLRELLANER